MNKPSKPRTCQNGKEERGGPGVFSGIGVTKTAVNDDGICVGIGVAEGVRVNEDSKTFQTQL
jgi:hypothetical protein